MEDFGLRQDSLVRQCSDFSNNTLNYNLQRSKRIFLERNSIGLKEEHMNVLYLVNLLVYAIIFKGFSRTLRFISFY